MITFLLLSVFCLGHETEDNVQDYHAVVTLKHRELPEIYHFRKSQFRFRFENKSKKSFQVFMLVKVVDKMSKVL